ncbi:MAG TPA: polyprenyl synthetase family protein [Dehalococcoidia bacterium]|nr:polyprenyl synthetase family protein [Dehalococcoidia bacterium]
MLDRTPSHSARSAAMRGLVVARLRELIAGVDPTYQADLLAVLSSPGRLLGPDPKRAIWPLFPLVFYEALTGDAAPAASAAAAIEVFAAAADLFDDLEDGDLTGDLATWNCGRLVNVASGLSMLAQVALLEAPTDVIPADRWSKASRILAKAAFVATGGQAADLLAEGRPAITIEECLALARDKAGSLISAACQMGAVLATDDVEILDLVGEFGLNLGVTQQLLNDLNDVRPEVQRNWKSDIVRRKKTLPIAYALNLLNSTDRSDCAVPPVFRSWFDSTNAASLAAKDESLIWHWLLDVGALHFAGLMADVYRRRALACLKQLESYLKPASTQAVETLVPVLT